MSSPDENIDWYVVKGNGGKAIGALGFVEDNVAVVASFYSDRDANRDGTVSIPEYVTSFLSPINTKGMAVMEVAMAARFDLEVLERDPTFHDVAVQMWLHFARNIIIDGAYAAWLSVGVKQVAGAVAQGITGNLIKQFVIKKGMESAVKIAAKKAVGRD